MELNKKFEFFSFHKIKLLLQLFVYKKIVSLKSTIPLKNYII